MRKGKRFEPFGSECEFESSAPHIALVEATLFCILATTNPHTCRLNRHGPLSAPSSESERVTMQPPEQI